MNGTRHIRDTLGGILKQEGVAFDLIVRDDRSEDDTLAVVREMAGDRVKVIVNSDRLGLAGNWNRCVTASRTPLVAVIHQDDVLLPGHLLRHRLAFDSAPSIGLVASASTVVDELNRDVPATVVDRGGLGPTDRLFAPGEALWAMAAGNPLRCSAVSIRVAAHADVGGFNPGLRYVVDWEFWLRVARRWSVAWLAKPTVAVRWHLASETHRFQTGTTDLEETERILQDLARMPSTDAIAAERIAKDARRRLARAYLNRAQVAARGGDGRLAGHCFVRSLKLSPRLFGGLVRDPRLAGQMAAVLLLPGVAGRWLRRELSEPADPLESNPPCCPP